jgi:hypothetical protein
MVYAHIISDLKAMNKAGRREKVNRELQGFMHGIINDIEKSKGERGKVRLDEERSDELITLA